MRDEAPSSGSKGFSGFGCFGGFSGFREGRKDRNDKQPARRCGAGPAISRGGPPQPPPDPAHPIPEVVHA
ncbi:hypothetical protein [Catenulispora subtropica]|uniref:Uncharacterized protein n=1 Tax=Catenulispora subtropica TaxID=450798 RepID=A0ABP5EZQ8_9ACTN